MVSSTRLSGADATRARQRERIGGRRGRRRKWKQRRAGVLQSNKHLLQRLWQTVNNNAHPWSNRVWFLPACTSSPKSSETNVEEASHTYSELTSITATVVHCSIFIVVVVLVSIAAAESCLYKSFVKLKDVLKHVCVSHPVPQITCFLSRTCWLTSTVANGVRWHSVGTKLWQNS